MTREHAPRTVEIDPRNTRLQSWWIEDADGKHVRQIWQADEPTLRQTA